MLLARCGHELHADADAEQRDAGIHPLAQRGDHPGEPGETGHAVDEGADPGQHDMVRPGERRGIGGHLDPGPAGRGGGGALEGLRRRSQVS